MELSITLNYIMNNCSNGPLDISKAAKLLHNSNFKYVDYTPDFISNDWKERVLRDKEVLNKESIIVEQTHAPFNRYCQYDEKLFETYYERLFEASSILGAKYVVVHADEYRTKDSYNEKEILEYTYNYLAPHVDFATKHHMIVAIENVFEDNNYRWPQINGKSRYTSRVEELICIIERFSSSNVACCWDFGHAKCAYGANDMAKILNQVGKYVVCTHVHDNYYGKDLHLLPFLGDTNWKENMVELKNVGYNGKLSFEFGYGKIPYELFPVFLNTAHVTGEYLIDLFKNC